MILQGIPRHFLTGLSLVNHQIRKWHIIPESVRIIFLDNGKMAEYGTYDELVALNGQFARLVRKQQLEKQLAQAN